MIQPSEGSPAGQHPLALFITCTDLRIDPNLLTQTAPGELFLLRSAGNVVAPQGTPNNSEGSTIEYAVKHLHVRDIIVCGHSRCEAMQGLLAPAAAVENAKKLAPGAAPAELLEKVIEQNVLLQFEHLQAYRSVKEAALSGRLRLHAWVYQLDAGQIMAYDAGTERFVPLTKSPKEKLLMPLAGEMPAQAGDAASTAPTSFWSRWFKRLWPGRTSPRGH